MDNSTVFDSASLVKCVWIAFLAEVVLVIPIAVMGWIAFIRSPVNEEQNPAFTFSKLFERAKTLQMITVILIIVSATLLALCKIIDSSGIVSIYSGIAGFVLGGICKQPHKNKPENPGKLIKKPDVVSGKDPATTKEQK